MKKAVLVLDCGATNVKACIIDEAGSIVSLHALPNATVSDIHSGGLIWDIHDIWRKLILCSQKVCSSIPDIQIIAITVTSFGVDGAPMKKDGSFCYPVISWQCSRTEEIEKNSSGYFDRDWMYQMTGLQSYHFNTVNKLIWFKENRPDVLETMDYYVLIPSILTFFLTGEFTTDTTMAGTSMLTDIRARKFSSEILDKLGLSTEIFPLLVEPGTKIGKLMSVVAAEMGIAPGIPVIASGHDTQFAILGSGVRPNQPVLSSGTWEILMARMDTASLQMPSRDSGITMEWDALPGITDCGLQWVASGVIEWIGRLLYADLEPKADRYSSMIAECHLIPPGCNGLTVVPEIYPGKFSKAEGAISGFTHETKRAHIYKATLESLSYYLRYALNKIQAIGNFRASEIICTGGGSKNALWNQIRADILGVRLKVPDVNEATALGAMMIAMTSLGVFNTIEDASTAVQYGITEYNPGINKEKYNELFESFSIKAF